MDYKFKTLAAIILTTGFTLSHAGFTYVYPMEASAGGPLSNNSITFVDKGSIGSGTGNNGGSNIGSGGETTDDKDEETVTPPVSSLEPTAQCDAYAVETNSYLQSKYPDVALTSHEYKTITLPFSGTTTSCIVTLSVPSSKSYSCIGNSNYADNIDAEVKRTVDPKYTINTARSYSYYGNCN
ncbi:TPA: hypothetical protein ACJXXT_000263 [Pseudomonas aeruginosa]|uniref:hypothetical protein n=1 Tax=Pseudomonas putida TaxID=303 RepID=UPI001BAEB0B9|nr:hypothetical protein [Pseudomonas putida]QUG90813.1 hypothetical protein GR140_19300 [Pseudomonas putida]